MLPLAQCGNYPVAKPDRCGTGPAGVLRRWQCSRWPSQMVAALAKLGQPDRSGTGPARPLTHEPSATTAQQGRCRARPDHSGPGLSGPLQRWVVAALCLPGALPRWSSWAAATLDQREYCPAGLPIAYPIFRYISSVAWNRLLFVQHPSYMAASRPVQTKLSQTPDLQKWK